MSHPQNLFNCITEADLDIDAFEPEQAIKFFNTQFGHIKKVKLVYMDESTLENLKLDTLEEFDVGFYGDSLVMNIKFNLKNLKKLVLAPPSSFGTIDLTGCPNLEEIIARFDNLPREVKFGNPENVDAFFCFGGGY